MPTHSSSSLSRIAVAPGDIERGLERLRSDLTGSLSTPQPRMRAILANIVVLIRGEGAFGNQENLDDFISHLAIAHPSRFFIVKINSGKELQGTDNKLIASEILSRQITPDSGAHLHSEEIYLEVTEEGTHLVPNMLLSLFVADVDVILVVPEPLGERSHEAALLRELRRLARLVLFDSSTFTEYARQLRLLLDTCENLEDPPSNSRRFADLSWRRTKRWRILLAECFDSERLLGSQGDVTRIKMFVCKSLEELHQKKISADAFLLAGWCITCLGWDLSNASWQPTRRGLLLDVQQADGKSKVQFEFITWHELSPSEAARKCANDPAFGVAGIEIILNPERDAVRLKLLRVFEKAAVEIILGATGSPSENTSCEFSVRYAPFRSLARDELVFRDILSNRGEEVYRRSLENSIRMADVYDLPSSQ